MRLKKYKLGELIELCDERNSDNKYKLSDVKGISTEKACRVNKQVQSYKKCLKNSTFGEEKFNFSLGLLLILA